MKYNSAWLKLVVIALFIAYSQHTFTQEIPGRKFDDLVVKVKSYFLPDVLNSKELKNFYGKDDPTTPKDLQFKKLQTWALNLCKQSMLYRNKGTEAYLPEENIGSRILANPLVSDLFTLTGIGMDYDRVTPFAKASKPYEDAFKQKIIQQPKHSLEPEDVLAIALEVTDGDYGLAVLTIHYVFKYATYQLRDYRDEAIKLRQGVLYMYSVNPEKKGDRVVSNRYIDKYNQIIKKMKELNKVVIPLKSLRENPKQSNDKMGPWYHTFALMVIDAYGGEIQAIASASAEHGTKAFKGFVLEGGFNKEKATIDGVFISTIVGCHALRRTL